MIPIRPTASSYWWSRCSTLALALFLAVVLAITLEAGIAQAATFSVTNTSDSGDGSLRDAITDANDTPNAGGPDDIDFDIPAATDPGCDATSGVCTISPTTALPEITEAVVIDGYSQSGASQNTLSVGNNAVLKIELSGEDPGAAGADAGIVIAAPNCVVKGLIINRWADDGVFVNGSGASGNSIEGNFIGTDASGTQDLGNADDGVDINDLTDNVVGGTAAAARNIISGNGYGVNVVNSDASGNKIQGNYIGTDASGTQSLGNDNEGVLISSAPNNVVGGTSAAARNIISANDDGIIVFGSEASGNRIEGNYVGTDASGTTDLGNAENGVFVREAPNNVVGGTIAGARNVIAFNGFEGVLVQGVGATGNSILRNSIFDNGELGIDLDGGTEDPNGVTANDPQDPDLGPNLLQNYPIITSATTPNGRSVSVQGTLNSNPNNSFNVQLFASPEADPSGYGEGKTYLGQTNVTANASGNTTFSLTSNTPVLAGEFVTATATNSVTGDTSEFSEAVEVDDTTRPTVVSSKPPDGATGVLPATNVSVIFSEQMQPSTINENTFQLFERVGGNLQPVEATVSYNATFRRGVLNPDENLTRGSRYVAKVTVGARDLAGNRLAQTETIIFVVAR